MPKLREKPDPDEATREIIRVAMAKLNCTQGELAKKCHLHPVTFVRRKQEPERFTLDEIRNLVKIAHLSDEDICRMVRG